MDWFTWGTVMVVVAIYLLFFLAARRAEKVVDAKAKMARAAMMKSGAKARKA
ncbi:MAG TPA: hypothetical protein VF531_15190 [Bacillota bacterium]